MKLIICYLIEMNELITQTKQYFFLNYEIEWIN